MAIDKKDNIIKLIPSDSENQSKDVKINNYLCNVAQLTNCKSLLAMIINQDEEVELVSKLGFEVDVTSDIYDISGLCMSLDDLEAISLQLANLVAVLKVRKLIK